MKHHSTTSQHGVFSRAPRYRSEELLTRGRELLLSDIKGGAFVKEWTEEQAVGATRLAELWERVLASPLSRAEEAVLPVVRGAREKES
jgi:ketol-acid reductoisomerase